MEKILFTSESVAEGHPDKVCDKIADSILDDAIKQDSESRVACEVFATKNTIVIGGEITSKATIDFEKIVKDVFISKGQGGAQPNISKEKIVNSLIPLPPLAEQKRIVAKIEELLPLCERLK